MEGRAHYWDHMSIRTQQYIAGRSMYARWRCRKEHMSYEWKGRRMRKEVRSSLYWPFKASFCCCICQGTISKATRTTRFTFLAWYIDISAVRWLGKCSGNTVEASSIYFFWFGAKRKGAVGGVREHSAPTMWQMMRVRGIGLRPKKRAKFHL